MPKMRRSSQISDRRAPFREGTVSTTSEVKQAVTRVEPLTRRYRICLLPCSQISKRGRSPYHGFDVRTSAQALANLEPEDQVPFSTPLAHSPTGGPELGLLTNPTGPGSCPRLSLFLATDWVVGRTCKAPGTLVPQGFGWRPRPQDPDLGAP